MPRRSPRPPPHAWAQEASGHAESRAATVANRADFEDAVTGTGRGLVRRMLDRSLAPPPALFRVFRKILDDDPRDWKDFVPF